MAASGRMIGVVLGAAEGLHPLAVGGAALVDVAGDRGGADEADRGHVRVVQQRVDRLLVAVHHVEHPVGQAGLGPQLGDQQRRARVAFAGLEHERVAAGDGHRVHPHRHHGREVERRDPGADPERLPEGEHVDAGGDLVGVVALERRRDAAGELDDLQAALHLAAGVRDDLAVLVGDDLGDVLDPVRSPARGTRTAPSVRLRQRGLRPGLRRPRPRSARRCPRRRCWPARPRPAARRWPGSTPGWCGSSCPVVGLPPIQCVTVLNVIPPVVAGASSGRCSALCAS